MVPRLGAVFVYLPCKPSFGYYKLLYTLICSLERVLLCFVSPSIRSNS